MTTTYLTESQMENLKPSIAETIQAVRQWGIDKGITGPNGKGTVAAQASKLREEANEVFEEVDLLCVGGRSNACKPPMRKSASVMGK